jgi:acetylornithine/N-succinyldiaminopimelate aminotransferase
MENIIWSTGHSLLLDHIVRAENCYLYDRDGRRYTDMESGVWCTGIGHCHPAVNRAIRDQSDKIFQSGFNYISPIVEKAALRVLEIAGFPGGKCVFLCSGSEAVEFGVRIGAVVSDKPARLTFADSYFGAYGQATHKQDPDWIRYNWLDCSCSGSGGCRATCKEFAAIPFGEIGLFLFEPGSSSGLVRFPSTGLIEKVCAKVIENGGLLMVNEVTTGAGRTGKWFGFEHYGIRPDIIAMGKGIGNGYPVSVTAVSEQVAGRAGQEQYAVRTIPPERSSGCFGGAVRY